jgi:hypothetical protein
MSVSESQLAAGLLRSKRQQGFRSPRAKANVRAFDEEKTAFLYQQVSERKTSSQQGCRSPRA